ncbi:putative ribonuclease H-like domain-containing protein [Tanacetum coccineum]
MLPLTVLTRSDPISLDAARPVNIVQPRTTVNNVRPMKNVINNAYSTARRPFNKMTAANNSNFTKKVNTVKGTRVNTAKPKAVISDVKGNKGNVVKASACWVWRPKHKVLDHVSRKNGVSMSFKRFAILMHKGNPQQDLRDKGVIDSGCSRHMTGNRSYLIDYEEIDGEFVSFRGNSKGGKLTGKDFKLTNESHVLHKVLRKDNMYSVDLKNVIPQGDLKVKVIRCDNGTEFKNRVMNQFCEMKGIKREFSVARTPQQNRVAERKNRTLIEAARTMLTDLKLPITFCAEEKTCLKLHEDHLGCLVTFLEYIITSGNLMERLMKGNQSNGNASTKACDDVGKTRMETVHGKDYILLPFWTQDLPFSSSSKDSSDAGFKPSGEEKKKDAEDPGNQDSEFPCTEESRVNQEKDANVNITNIINTVSSTINTASIEYNLVDDNIVYGCADDLNMPELEEIGRFSDAEDDISGADMNNLDTYFQVSHVPTTRIHKDHPIEKIIGDLNSTPQTRRIIRNLEEHGFLSTSLEQRRNHKDIQNCFKSFYNSSYKKFGPWWSYLMEKRAIGTKWVFRNKKDERGIVIKNKARFVAQGYIQEEGIDYDEVFALVSRIEAIKLFLAYASFKDFMVYQMDVKSAFLDGKIEEEVYVCQPPGFEDPDFPNRRGKIDKTLFIKRDKSNILLVQVYVDDIIFGSTRKKMCIEFKKMMHKKFQMSSMGELIFFLGLQVKQKEDGIFISQDKYMNKILNKFGFSDVKTARTPMETQKALIKDADGEDVDEHLYRSMIGLLVYLTPSRPDIMFAVCACARIQVNPKSSRLEAMKRIFRHLKGQPKLGLLYPKDSPFDLVAYTDSDYAGESLDRKSTIGGCQFLGCRLILWQCKNQTMVANSTTEAEYIAASNCCGQVIYIQNQLLDYGYNFMQTKIYIDNESTICIVKNPVFHSKTKHIQIRHHFICDSNEKKVIQMIQIHTDHNVTTLLPKAYDVSRFQYLIAMLLVILNTVELILLVILTTAVIINIVSIERNWHNLLILGTTAGSVNAVRLNLVLLVQVNAVEVDKKKVIITKTSIRSDLQLEDAETTEYLPNAIIFERLTLMGAKTTAWNEFSSTMASAIICLATNQKFNFSKYIFDNMVKNLEGEVKFLMYPRFVQCSGYNKGTGKDFSSRDTPLFPTMIVQAQKQSRIMKQSRRKQRKNTEDPQLSGLTEPVTDDSENVVSVPTHSNDPLLSGEDRLKLNELMELCTSLS